MPNLLLITFYHLFAEELRLESPTYVRLIEDKDHLSLMTIWQRAVLCASVLSSPIYREERLEYSTKWISDHANDLIFVEELLPFTYSNQKGKKSALICDCIICKGFTNGDYEKSESTDLCITRSYDNHSSLYVIKLHRNFNFLDKYFRRMAILTNARELFKNYNEKKSFELSIDD